MNRTQLEKEWLVNSALIAFVGATLVAQSWRISSSSINLFGLATFDAGLDPSLHVGVGVLLACASLLCLLAYWISSLRAYVIRAAPFVSPTLGLLLFVALFVGLPSTILELNLPPWIVIIWLVICGVLILFVGIHTVTQFIGLFKKKSSNF